MRPNNGIRWHLTVRRVFFHALVMWILALASVLRSVSRLMRQANSWKRQAGVLRVIDLGLEGYVVTGVRTVGLIDGIMSGQDRSGLFQSPTDGGRMRWLTRHVPVWHDTQMHDAGISSDVCLTLMCQILPELSVAQLCMTNFREMASCHCALV
jgi:hypothetical protein